MKRLITTLACVSMLCLTGLAQNLKKDIESGKRVEFNFNYSSRGDIPLHGGGSAVIQLPCYRIQANGLTIISNGATRWTVDNKSMEVYVEDDSGITDNIISRFWEIPLTEQDDHASGTFQEGDKKFVFSLHQIVRKERIEADEAEFNFGINNLNKKWLITDLR